MPAMTKSERVKLWLDRLARFAQSNLRVAEFCAAEGISIASYYQWKRRLSPRVLSDKQISSQQQQPFTELIFGSGQSNHSTAQPPAQGVVHASIHAQGSTPEFSTAAAFGQAGRGPGQTQSGRTLAPAQAFLPGDITLTLGTHPEIVAVIVDRLLQHANHRTEGKSSC